MGEDDFNFVQEVEDSPPPPNDENIVVQKEKTEKKEEPKKAQIQIPSQTQTYKNQKIETVTNFENLRLFKFTCFDNFCYLEKDSNSDKNSEIPFEILKKQIQNVKSDNLFFYQRNKKMIIYILDDAQKFNFIQGVRNDDSFQKVKDIDTNPNLFNQPKG